MEGLQGSWSETQLLVECPDSRHVVANDACRREVVDDEQTHGGGIWIDEVKMIMRVVLDESLCLSGVVTGRAWSDGIRR